VALIVVTLVMPVSRVAWNMDRSHDSIQVLDSDGAEFADKGNRNIVQLLLEYDIHGV